MAVNPIKAIKQKVADRKEAKWQKKKKAFVQKSSAALSAEKDLKAMSKMSRGEQARGGFSGITYDRVNDAVKALDDFGATSKEHVEQALAASNTADTHVNLAAPGDDMFRTSPTTENMFRRLSSFHDGHNKARG